MTILVTGGFGFIGSAFVRRYAMLNPDELIVVLDNFTYAANFANLTEVGSKRNFGYYVGDVADPQLVRRILREHDPRVIMHFAAESHVDNSIKSTTPFLHSNVYGTVNLLDQVASVNRDILFVHVSTDEVFGSLDINDPPFNEDTPYAPRSPYAASKAASDHFVRAYSATHKLRTVITNCSNNYGPYQHREKFIPTVIWKAINDERIPVYGTGMNMRDWLYVEDHVDALISIIERGIGVSGKQYCIGGGTQLTNVNLAMEILGYLGKPIDLIQFVEDRKGHDFRYDIDSDRLYLTTGWKPTTRFDRGLSKTVEWYRNNLEWVMTCRNASESYSQAAKARGSIPQHSPPLSKFSLSMTSL
jgi:dTDP-glucose 4,6-dehydratase